MLADLKIGAVSYLNTKPLVYQLQELLPDAKITYDLPSRLADKLAAGKLDVALIPSIEILQDQSYRIVSDACIGCCGPVLSVKLFTRVPFEQIKTLALDEGSRTSAALVQILLWNEYGIRPQLQQFSIGSEAVDTSADAVLLIGDRAMHHPPGNFIESWDLGDQWCRLTDTSFVFAMWTARADMDCAQLEVALESARDLGVSHLKEIAAEEAAGVRLSREAAYHYLKENLYFHLGPRQRSGLQLFCNNAIELGLAPATGEFQFYDCQTS